MQSWVICWVLNILPPPIKNNLTVCQVKPELSCWTKEAVWAWLEFGWRSGSHKRTSSDDHPPTSLLPLTFYLLINIKTEEHLEDVWTEAWTRLQELDWVLFLTYISNTVGATCQAHSGEHIFTIYRLLWSVNCPVGSQLFSPEWYVSRAACPTAHTQGGISCLPPTGSSAHA